MGDLFRYEQPATVDDAVELLEGRPEAVVLAGGTDLMVGVNFRRTRPDDVVGLRRVQELEVWDGSRVGAMVSYRRMVRGPFPALAQAARAVGSVQIRNVGTLGGNLATASPAGDTLPVLAACDASVELASVAGRRTLRWDEFVIGPKRTTLRPGELIAAAVFPEHLPARQAFAKIGARNAMVISVVSACVVREESGITRIALGAVGTTPVRAHRAEMLISAERRPSEVALAELARLVSEEVAPITDHRSTATYRRQASGVLARRLVERCL